jgi:DNA-binding NarL/FixJ family response regulator
VSAVSAVSAVPTPVWIIGADASTRARLVALVEEEPDLRCDRAVAAWEPGLAPPSPPAPPLVAVLDVEPGGDGVAGIAGLKARDARSQIVVLSPHGDDLHIFAALRAGAIGYLLKPVSGPRVLQAVRTAARGGAPLDGFVARKVIEAFLPPGSSAAPDPPLTAREREILRLLTEARSQKQIARELGLSRHTVDSHLRNIYAKLDVHSRAAAVARAFQDRLV